MDVRTLKCPSCGSNLTLPQDLKVAHCIYCGNQLVLEPTEAATNKQQVARYERLGEIALQAQNFADLSQYAEKILELDTDNASGWIYKAHVAFAELFHGMDSAEEEAKHYLQLASKITPDDKRVADALETWGRVMFVRQSDTIEEHLTRLRSAIDQGERSRMRECAVRTVEAAMRALPYAPDEGEATAIVEGIEGIAGRNTWIDWTSEVQHQLAGLRAIQSRRATQGNIRELRAAHRDQQMMLDKLKNRTGFFADRKIKQAERKLQELDREVENAQRILVEQESVIARARSKWGSFYSLR